MNEPADIPASAMTIPDSFAEKAMAALVASSIEMSPDDIAEYAYAIAAAMLNAREHVPTAWPRLHTDFAKEP